MKIETNREPTITIVLRLEAQSISATSLAY